MDFPPVLPLFSMSDSPFLSQLWRQTRRGFGHVWKLFGHNLPIYPLIVCIQEIAGSYFFKTKGQGTSAKNSSNEAPWSHTFGPDIVIRNIERQNASDLGQKVEKFSSTSFDISKETSFLQEVRQAKELLDPEIQDIGVDVDDCEKKELDRRQNLHACSDALATIMDLYKILDRPSLKTWQENLDLTNQLQNECAILRLHHAQVKGKDKLELHQCMQTIIQKLDDMIRQGEVNLCKQIKKQYKSVLIPSDGHCFFWAIDHQLQTQKGPQYYRKLAVDFMRAHPSEFRAHVNDAFKTKQVNDKINQYIKTQSREVSWRMDLEKKLGRKPNIVDYYCDCLELEELEIWGGYPEILALSKQLQVSILVFTGSGAAWRFDVKAQQSKDHPFVLLFYNGINHYQSLIPKTTQ